MPAPLHRVRIRLRYTENRIPWKWDGRCVCGWRCLSWAWIRTEAYGYEYDDADGTGALPMALEHLREKS